jgi:hypothetical protein
VLVTFSFLLASALTIGALLIITPIFSAIVFFLWMIVIDFLHLFLVACFRTREYFRRRVLEKNIFVCPNCHEDIWETPSKIPLYRCKNTDCHEIHRWLWPNTYGIFFHKCKCGEKIPAYWKGKAKLSSYCPNCKTPLKTYTPLDIDGFGILPRLGIGIMGASGAGKTSFMIAAFKEFQTKIDFKIKLADKNKEKDLEALKNSFKQGKLAPTHNGNPGAFIWRLTTRKDDFLMYMYDPSGELENKEFRFLSQVHALVLIINAEDLDSPITAVNNESVLEKAMSFLEKDRGLVGKLDIPMAVVFNKNSDEPADISDLLTYLKKRNSNLINMIEASFEPVEYFSCTASATAKTGVIDPFLWLLENCGKVKKITFEKEETTS